MSRDKSQDLLQKYLSGAITAREEAELFELAKNDAFLSEAIEGYSKANIQDKNIEQIRIELAKKYRSESRIIPGLSVWLKMAASIVILSGIIWIFRNNVGHQRALGVALKTQVSETGDYLSAGVDDTMAFAVITDDRLSKELENEQPRSVSGGLDSYGLPRPKEIASATVSTSSSYNKLEAEFDIASVDEDLSKINEEVKPEDLALKTPPPTNNLSIQGTVVDDYGNPLIGVSIVVERRTTGTITDVDGTFEMDVSDTEPHHIIVSYPGFESHSEFATPGEQIQIVLNEGVVLMDEIVVTGYAVQKIKETIEPKTRAKVRVGEKQFKEYEDQNQIYPDSARINNIHGKVKLRFQVLPNGKIGEIEVINALGFGCDEEAIRLLREGPLWEVIPEGSTAWETWTFKF